MSLFIDSGAGLVLSIWFVLAVVLNSENNVIIAKLVNSSVWCGVAIMNGQIVYREEEGRPVVVKRKLDGAMDGFPAD